MITRTRRKPSAEQCADRGGKSITSHKHYDTEISNKRSHTDKIGSHGKEKELKTTP